MPQCSIYDKSLRFSRALYGILIIIGFFTKNPWYVLAVIIMLALGTINIKLNIPYQIHVFFVKKILKKQTLIIQKESTELNFVSGMTAILLLLGFLAVYFNKFTTLGWIWLLIMSLLLFLACLII